MYGSWLVTVICLCLAFFFLISSDTYSKPISKNPSKVQSVYILIYLNKYLSGKSTLNTFGLMIRL